MNLRKMYFLMMLLIVFSSLVFSASIKVKSPNGGESWQMDSEKLIKWEKSGDFTGFQIILRKANKRVGDIGWVLNPNTTSFLWKKVGEYEGGNVAAGNDYKIRVRGYLANGNMADASDGDFTITTKPKTFSRIEVHRKKPPVTYTVPATINQALGVSKTGLHATPGGRVAIKGKDLGEAKGHIYLYGNGFTNGRLSLQDIKWESSTKVNGKVPPYISGVMDQMVEVQVETKDGRLSNKIKMPFYAKRIIKYLKWNDPVVKCLQYGKDSHFNICAPPDSPPTEFNYSCTFYGYHRVMGGLRGTTHGTGKGDDVFSITLKNGWTIDDGSRFLKKELTSGDEDLKGYWSDPVKSGSGFKWKVTFHWVVSEGDKVVYAYQVKIKGPIGVSYK